MKSTWILISLICAVSLTSTQAQSALKDLGFKDAKKGGTFQRDLLSEPKTLNPLTSTDVPATRIHKLVMDRLLVRNYDTNELEPGIAERYEEDRKNKTFTFYIRKGVKFHNGMKLTAKDVKFGYEALVDPRYDTAHILPYFENVKKAELLDEYTIRFHLKKNYFGNLLTLATLIEPLPYEVYKNPKKKINKTVIGSGPYKLLKYQKGKSLTLIRNKDWWGFKTEEHKNSHNYEKVKFRFVKEGNIALEMLKKGKLDFFQNFTADDFAKKTKGKPWGTKVFAKKVKNKIPKTYGYIAWNFKNDLFKKRDVRAALSYLFNRPLMIKKYMHGLSMEATGPWYRQSPFAAPDVKPFGFEPKKAMDLLKKAGWKDTDKNGILDKVINGKKREFKFTLMYGSVSAEKYYTIFREDLKKAGIQMSLKKVEWNSLVRALDEKKFDAVSLAWGGGEVDNDPKQIWHSESSKRAGGSNFISYKNPEVDKLIDKGRATLNRKERIKIYQKIYRKIAYDAPYTFMFVKKYELYAVSKKVKMKKDTLGYDLGFQHWVMSPQ